MLSTEDAAGSPSPTISGPPPTGRATVRPRHRGGVKHRKAVPVKTAPPAQSSTPCPFGCGCWFRERCSFAHPVEDHELWQQERAARLALFDISTARKKARLEGRAARRSALSSLTNNTATENTGAAKKEQEKESDSAGVKPYDRAAFLAKHSRHEAIVQATVQVQPDPPPLNTSLSQWGTLFSTQMVTAFVSPTVFQAKAASMPDCQASRHLLQHGTGWCFFDVTVHNSTHPIHPQGDDAHCIFRLRDKDNAKGFNDIVDGGIKVTLDRLRTGQVVILQD